METTNASGSHIDLHLYAPFEGLKGIEPVPLVAAIPFYADPEMTDAIGTLTIVGVTIPSEVLPSYFYCDIAFGWHGKDENLAAADTILTMTGMMIQGDPRARRSGERSPGVPAALRHHRRHRQVRRRQGPGHDRSESRQPGLSDRLRVTLNWRPTIRKGCPITCGSSNGSIRVLASRDTARPR